MDQVVFIEERDPILVREEVQPEVELCMPHTIDRDGGQEQLVGDREEVEDEGTTLGYDAKSEYEVTKEGEEFMFGATQEKEGVGNQRADVVELFGQE